MVARYQGVEIPLAIQQDVSSLLGVCNGHNNSDYSFGPNYGDSRSM